MRYLNDVDEIGGRGLEFGWNLKIYEPESILEMEIHLSEILISLAEFSINRRATPVTIAFQLKNIPK